jgi:hypothetical protein
LDPLPQVVVGFTSYEIGRLAESKPNAIGQFAVLNDLDARAVS